MALQALPAKYYLTHFHEFLQFIEEHYLPVLEVRHREFLVYFKDLSEDAQCIYVRMVNRKGLVFAKAEFNKYSEINADERAFIELAQKKFTTSIGEQNKLDLLDFFNKKEIQQWFKKSDVPFSQVQSVAGLRELARKHKDQLRITYLRDLDQLIVQSYQEELSYLLFLFFGFLQTSLSLYTLHDLGLRQKSQLKEKFKPRYTDVVVAKTEFQLLKLSDALEDDQIDFALEFCSSITSLKPSTIQLKGELLLEIASRLQAEQPEKAISALKQASVYPARVNLAKIYYKLERKQECRKVLEDIIDRPLNDEEILFAEDYLDRKFNKKKMGFLTQALLSAEEISLSEAYFKKPEAGVKDFYEKKGVKATFTENYLWCGLFGLLFWTEIFETEEAALHNPFERSPTDLVGEEFYLKHKKQIEEKLLLLKNLKKAESLILKTVATNYGKLNDIVLWRPTLANLILTFLKASQKKDVAHILRTMSQNFSRYHSGYPDLMLEVDEEIQFTEVKAEGDSLRTNQLSKLRLLKEAGFKVHVLKVNWVTDPHQVYVVVDIETTGGMAKFHKITEIGAVKVQNGKVIDEFQSFINPGRSIPSFITKLTGITNEMVSEAPKFSEIADKFFEFTKGAIFVAHNVRFDYSFIQQEYQRIDVNYVRPSMCTVQGMRKHYPGLTSYSLKSLCTDFNISLVNHHRAMADAKAATALLNLIQLKKTPESVDEANYSVVQESVVDRHFFD